VRTTRCKKKNNVRGEEGRKGKRRRRTTAKG
jgi:hypothetical protein